MTMTRAVTAAAIAAAFAFVNAGTAAAADIAFEMDVLPSAVGATYYSETGTESDYFSVAGGVLFQDSPGTDQSAEYLIEDIYDPALPAILSWRAKVISGGEGAYIALYTPGGYGFGVAMYNNGLSNGLGPIVVPMNTTDAFHDYEIRIPANGSEFKLFVDGVLRYFGPAFSTATSDVICFGDCGGRDGAELEWDYVRFSNGGDGCDLNGDGVFNRADTLKFIKQCRAQPSRGAQR